MVTACWRRVSLYYRVQPVSALNYGVPEGKRWLILFYLVRITKIVRTILFLVRTRKKLSGQDKKFILSFLYALTALTRILSTRPGQMQPWSDWLDHYVNHFFRHHLSSCLPISSSDDLFILFHEQISYVYRFLVSSCYMSIVTSSPTLIT